MAHKSLPAFSPYLSDATLPYLAFFLLASTFTLAFYFTTCVFRVSTNYIKLT